MDRTEFLVLEARFLAGTYGGTEWPPSPFRLLQAIVAGCRVISVPGLEWLEQQPPPLILATDEPKVASFRKSIPNNVNPAKPSEALSMRRVVHRRVDQPVWYCYRLHQAHDREAAKQVISAAERVHTLGTGVDMCAVNGTITQHAPESNLAIRLWVPEDQTMQIVRFDSALRLRVPIAGSLRSVEDRFQAFQRRLDGDDLGYARPVAAPALHRIVGYRPSDERPRTAVFALCLTGIDDVRELRRFPVEHAVVVAGMLRHAAMQFARTSAPDLADFASGYAPPTAPDCRMSWVPIPSVGHRNADGLIRRGLWLSRACDADKLEILATMVPSSGVPLIDESTGECLAMAAPVDLDEEPVLSHYTAAAHEWTSITPIVLPGDYGGGNLRIMTKLLHKALREAGIDPGLLEGVEFSKTGFIRQAASVGAVRLKAWKAKNLILYHLRLRFHRPIRGPVVLGRGRHFGLGLFCANPN